MAEESYKIQKGKWLINIRRWVQGLAFIFFFFLLFHTDKVKNLEFPILTYLFIALTIFSIIYIYKIIKNLITKEHPPKLIIIKSFSVVLSTIVLGLILSYYHQFSTPERITYLKQKKYTIKQAISLYEQDKRHYQVLKDFSTIKTKTSEDTKYDIVIYLPVLVLIINYLLLLASVTLIGIFIYLFFKKREPHILKPSFVLLIICSALSLLLFSLLEYDFKKEFKDYTAEGFYFFPIDFVHYNYFITIPQNIFLKTSSLLGIATSIALKSIVIGIGFILFFLLVSVILGRVFCGWVCPFGTLHQIVSFIRMKIRKGYVHEVYSKNQKVKYIILTVILVTAFFSVNFSGLFDPISIMTKSSSIFVIPSTQYSVTSTYDYINKESKTEKEGGLFTLLNNIYTPIKNYLEEYIFYYSDPGEAEEAYVPTHYSYFFLNGIIFIGLILLNFKNTRFWCLYICPLGALLGVFANRSAIRIDVNENCTSCGKCDKFCQGPSSVSIKDEFKTSECMYCFNCIKGCPSDALVIKWTLPIKKSNTLVAQKVNITKRALSLSLLTGFLSFLALRSTLWAKRVNPKLIRPPGAVEESDFLAQCIKCSECMKVCPKNFLHPSFLEAGIEGMFTPIAIGKLGYCEHTCNACGYVCPTQAISKLTLYKKQQVKIGLALVRKDRCLTYAHQTPCIVCEEHCPTSPKSIWVKPKEVQKRDGTKLTVDQIYVDADLCIGCGICEYVCPVVDEPGIYITSIQESRSKSNQLLLRDNNT